MKSMLYSSTRSDLFYPVSKQGNQIMQVRVEKALDATVDPLQINQTCQTLRMERVDTDKVYDKVEKDLAKEIQTTHACAQLLASTRDTIVEQVRKDRSARYYLEKVRFPYYWALFTGVGP